MWNDIREVYRASWNAAFLLPLLFLVSPVVEFIQHVIELQAGMYDSLAAAKAVSNDAGRMASGFAKIIALFLPSYWFVRLMAFGDPRRAARLERPAILLWLVLLVFNIVQAAADLFGPPLGEFMGLHGQAAKLAGPVAQIVWTAIGVYLTAWAIAWTLGNRSIGPIRSFRVMSGSFWRTIGYMIAGTLPLMVLHYALGYVAIILLPTWLDWPAMVIDALVVGFMACTIVGSGYVAARHAANRKAVALAPPTH